MQAAPQRGQQGSSTPTSPVSPKCRALSRLAQHSFLPFNLCSYRVQTGKLNSIGYGAAAGQAAMGALCLWRGFSDD